MTRPSEERTMSKAAEFNGSTFGRWINSPGGRIFRVAAGTMFLGLGLARAGTRSGTASALWGLLPLSAGALDICYISAALGGPLRGEECRTQGLAGRRH